MAANIQIARYEAKYHISPAVFPGLLRRVRQYCAPDANATGGDWYTIHSLYFDNAGFRTFHDAEANCEQRFKLRVRTYDAPNAPVKLEVKRRNGDLVLKTSALVSRSDWEARSAHGIRAITGPLGRDTRFSDFLTRFDLLGRDTGPKMLVAYDRLAFSSRIDDYVRVTFDARMRCQRVSTLDVTGSPRLWRFVDDPVSMGESHSGYLMELKFVHTAPRWLTDLIASYGLRRQGYSKYGRAVRRYVYGEEPAWDLRPAPATAARTASVDCSQPRLFDRLTAAWMRGA